MCGCANIVNEIEEPIHVFTEADYDRVITGIYAGTITVNNLDKVTYEKIAKKLTEGVYQGYKKSISDVLYHSPDWTMLNDLRTNVYIFSGAKTYQQTKAVSALLSEKDAITSFKDFKDKANNILKEYNENYLKTEYNSSIAQAQSASQWQEIMSAKDDLPMLTYHTVGDQRVRFSHAALDGISRPVKDKFWSKNFPPNDWNCRCTTLQSDDEEVSSLKGYKVNKHVNPVFQFNAGKQRIIFSKKHPYFDVAAKDKTLAKQNFNLPIP